MTKSFRWADLIVRIDGDPWPVRRVTAAVRKRT